MTTRRSFLNAAALTPAAALAQSRPQLKGRLKQSATRSCFGRRKTIEQIAREAAECGLRGLDLIPPSDWPVLKKYGLVPVIAPSAGHSLVNGINDPANHAAAEAATRDMIRQAAAAGAPNVIVLSGNRRSLTREQGIENCVTFLNKLKAEAEDKGVTICLELLNSKVDHPDYQCDHTAWGVEVIKRVASPRVKLLYDIYHMQIMEGDIIRTIRENIAHIGHFHTAGNPGRNEIDPQSQELNYRAIAQAIVETGYTGYLGHEYSPKRDPLESLAEAVRICDV
ncbi:MAG: hydroxypyruvate isomerase family protein [bacterium]|jgi:hydroxypyruvate isomerase